MLSSSKSSRLSSQSSNSLQSASSSTPIATRFSSKYVLIALFRTIDYSKSFSTRCPCCSSNINTVVNLEAGNATYLWAGVIFCCVSPFCACIPFMTDKCADKNHYCPQCGFNVLRKHKGYFDCD